MKRFSVLLGALALSGFLIGCGGDSRDYLVTQTVSLMNEAATATDGVTTAIKSATKKAEGDKNKLDLTEAAKAADALKETGTKLQKMKQNTENLRGSIPDSEREENAKTYGNKIVGAMQALNTAKDDLQKALKQSEELNKKKTDDLRVKIREAEAPFEAVARQQ